MRTSEMQNSFILNELLKICISQSNKLKNKNVGFLQERKTTQGKE